MKRLVVLHLDITVLLNGLAGLASNDVLAVSDKTGWRQSSGARPHSFHGQKRAFINTYRSLSSLSLVMTTLEGWMGRGAVAPFDFSLWTRSTWMTHFFL